MSYYTAVSILMWIALTVLSILVIENDRLPREKKLVLCIAYVVVGLAALAEYVGLKMNGDPAYSPLVIRLVKCADYILTPLAGGVILVQFRSGEATRTLTISVIVFNTVLQVASIFTGWMLTVDSNNYYHHGKLYAVYVVLYLFMIILIAIEYLLYGYKFRKQNRVSLFATLILMALGIIMQETADGSVRTAYLGMTLGLAMLFIHNTEYEQMATDDTLKEQRFKILMSQIQPHFLYNTLGAIQEMCMSEPYEAMLATEKFSRYLRGNMDSLSFTGLIPFEKELEHTKLYLELEKMRFEEALMIEFDIKCKDFDVPPLTLQPIAENAVRHGARGKRHLVGIVRISTSEEADRYVITIADNGPGFNPKKEAQRNDGRSHVGIENVRERLHEMCGGKLLIDSELGRGTQARIIIPKG